MENLPFPTETPNAQNAQWLGTAPTPNSVILALVAGIQQRRVHGAGDPNVMNGGVAPNADNSSV